MSGKEKPWDIKERTFAFALEIVKFAQSTDFRNEASRTLGRQLLRSGTSIGANVEEAQAGQSRADFISKYAIALKESRETRYWLRLLKEAGLSPQGEWEALLQEADEIAHILGAIIVNAKNNRTRR
ncbi:MAG: four helix bundle protein [Deltaproteobacteria bacterium]|nr:four helix bundle protein [Deltaproteobacteria bacterium]